MPVLRWLWGRERGRKPSRTAQNVVRMRSIVEAVRAWYEARRDPAATAGGRWGPDLARRMIAMRFWLLVSARDPRRDSGVDVERYSRVSTIW
jgi:hypothetical protein